MLSSVLALVVTFAVTVAASAILTGVVRAYALRHHILDLPNARSSHSRPTPRGGGLAVVASYLAALGWLGGCGALAVGTVIGLAGAGLLVAAIGFVDDHRDIPASWRLVGHIVAAGWGLWWLGGLPAIPLGGRVWDAGLAGTVLGAIGLVWLLNLYNFMDGIDGIAGSEAVFVGAAGAVLAGCSGAPGLAWAAALLAAAAAGFLGWNWPPARIFMGDVGSGFLGLTFGLLAIADAAAGAVPLAVWLILLGVFVVDATVTLIRRSMRGERWYAAHRSHAYQHLARRWGSHRPVTMAVAAVNLGWLLPLAVAAWTWPRASLAIAVVALAPLVVLAVRLGAGLPEPLRGAPGRDAATDGRGRYPSQTKGGPC